MINNRHMKGFQRLLNTSTAAKAAVETRDDEFSSLMHAIQEKIKNAFRGVSSHGLHKLLFNINVTKNLYSGLSIADRIALNSALRQLADIIFRQEKQRRVLADAARQLPARPCPVGSDRDAGEWLLLLLIALIGRPDAAGWSIPAPLLLPGAAQDELLPLVAAYTLLFNLIPDLDPLPDYLTTPTTTTESASESPSESSWWISPRAHDL